MAEVGYVIHNIPEIRDELLATQTRVDAATALALRAVQSKAKSMVKSSMRGRPRWDHRGASTRTGAAVDLGLSPHHVTKSGGPGKLTGRLSKGVGFVKRPKKIGSEFHGGVGVGGQVQNLYKRKVEQKYPYLKPGIDKAWAGSDEIWAASWNKAMDRWR